MCENVVLHTLLMLLTFHSPRGVTDYFRRLYVPHIQQWSANPTADISPSILSRSIPTHLFPLYKAPRGTIFHFSSENLQDLQRIPAHHLTNHSNFQVFIDISSKSFTKDL